MKHDFSFAIAETGQRDGDRRYAELAKLLPNVTNDIHAADAVIFPVPFKWDGELMSALLPERLILAGNVSAAHCDEAAKLGLTLLDYCAGESFAVANALLTAEGALELAMRETGFTLCGSRALVIGFGRIGKLLANRLSAMGSEVSVYARSDEARAWAKAYGYRESRYTDANAELSRYDLIFNTAPALVLDANALSVARHALIIDLASKPGGLDYEAAQRLEVRAIHALALPGKSAPISAAMIIRDAIAALVEPRMNVNGRK